MLIKVVSCLHAHNTILHAYLSFRQYNFTIIITRYTISFYTHTYHSQPEIQLRWVLLQHHCWLHTDIGLGVHVKQDVWGECHLEISVYLCYGSTSPGIHSAAFLDPNYLHYSCSLIQVIQWKKCLVLITCSVTVFIKLFFFFLQSRINKTFWIEIQRNNL